MTTSVRQQLMSKTNPRADSATRSASPQRVAGPIDLLGAPPRTDVTHLSSAARALASTEAAQVAAFPPPQLPTGLGINFTA